MKMRFLFCNFLLNSIIDTTILIFTSNGTLISGASMVRSDARLVSGGRGFDPRRVRATFFSVKIDYEMLFYGPSFPSAD